MDRMRALVFELRRPNALAVMQSAERGEAPFPQRPFFENLVAGGQLTKVVSERISVAHGDMPEFIFEPEEIADLVEYLISIQVK